MRDLRSRTSRDGPQSGQTMAEYALVLAVITAGVIASATALSGAIMSGIDNVTAMIAGIV